MPGKKYLGLSQPGTSGKFGKNEDYSRMGKGDFRCILHAAFCASLLHIANGEFLYGKITARAKGEPAEKQKKKKEGRRTLDRTVRIKHKRVRMMRFKVQEQSN